MTQETPRRHTAWRVVPACAVLAVATLTGFLVRHARPVPDAAASVDWHAACQGRDGEDLHRLLGDGGTGFVKWSGYGSVLGTHADISQSCLAGVDDARVTITVTSGDAGWLRPYTDLLTHPGPGDQRFTAGDAAVAGSDHAVAAATCHTGGRPALHAHVVLRASGAPTRDPDRRRLMENIVRAWANAVQGAKDCGAPNV